MVLKEKVTNKSIEPKRSKQAADSFPDGSDIKESVCNVGDLGLIPRLGKSPEEGMATHSRILA